MIMAGYYCLCPSIHLSVSQSVRTSFLDISYSVWIMLKFGGHLDREVVQGILFILLRFFNNFSDLTFFSEELL